MITTNPGDNYAGVWGTSFSTAQLSGTAALLIQLAPGLDVGRVADALDHGHRIEQGMGDDASTSGQV